MHSRGGETSYFAQRNRYRLRWMWAFSAVNPSSACWLGFTGSGSGSGDCCVTQIHGSTTPQPTSDKHHITNHLDNLDVSVLKMDRSLTVQPTAALITTTNDPHLNTENDATTARARAKTLPLPTDYSKYPKAPGRISVSDAPVLLRPLPSAYQGSSPRKYQFGTQQVDGDVGATPISPTVLAFHTREFPALATGRVEKSKQSSPLPPSDSPTIPTLGRCAQSCKEDIQPPQQMVFEPSVNMSNPFTGPGGPGPMVSQLSPRSIVEGKLKKSRQHCRCYCVNSALMTKS
jgi:hypothetical protein